MINTTAHFAAYVWAHVPRSLADSKKVIWLVTDHYVSVLLSYLLMNWRASNNIVKKMKKVLFAQSCLTFVTPCVP